MKNTIKFIAACAILTGAGGSFAAGQHGGGHDGDTIGKPGVVDKVSRTINVDMADEMRFSPNDIQVKQGETIRFVVKNSGKLSHEFVLGTAKDLKDHYEVMKKNPEMEHAEDNQVTVKPGQTGEVIWRFTKAVKVDFACLHPGHYDAGMKGNIKVASAK
ncbi:MAG: cupredoxin family protein [Rhodoferax sp.]